MFVLKYLIEKRVQAELHTNAGEMEICWDGQTDERTDRRTDRSLFSYHGFRQFQFDYRKFFSIFPRTKEGEQIMQYGWARLINSKLNKAHCDTVNKFPQIRVPIA